jgi:hypothetical protein
MKADSLVGAWRLCSFEYKAEGGRCFAPLGNEPQGLLIYDRSGYMSGMMAKRDRPLLSTNDLSRIPENEKAAISDGFIAYSGRYEVDGDKVIHNVEVSFVPNWAGTPLDRFCQFEGKKLVLKTPPTNFNGREYEGYVTWERL